MSRFTREKFVAGLLAFVVLFIFGSLAVAMLPARIMVVFTAR